MPRNDAGRGKVLPLLCASGPQLYGRGGRPSLAFPRGFHLANQRYSSNPRDLAVACAKGQGSESRSRKWAGPRPPRPSRPGKEGRDLSVPEIRLARLYSPELGVERQPRCECRQGTQELGRRRSVARKGTKSSSARPPTSGSYCSSSHRLYRTLVLPGGRKGAAPTRWAFVY